MRRHSYSLLRSAVGFTLIELLIVIAVLGVLAAGVGIAINPSKRMSEARDARRKADLRQINNALEAYYVRNRHYPITAGGLEGDFNSAEEWWNFTNFLPQSDLRILPTDPKNGEINKYWYYYAYYYYSPTGEEFELDTFLENEDDADLVNDGGDQPSARCGVKVYETGTDETLIQLLGC